MLPNGFHDSEIRAIRINYEQREATVDWSIDYSSPEQDQSQPARDAQIIFRGVTYFVIETPDPKYPYGEARRIDVNDVYKSPHENIEFIPPPVPNNSLQLSLFVNDWNSFIHIAAQSAELIWPEK
jgi:hypothetical protein